MKEIGGYIELDTYNSPMLHEGAVALNCGRNALAYLIRAKGIKRICMPYFICDSVPEVCTREGVIVRYYNVGMDLLPAEGTAPDEDEWLYLVNYYGQLCNEDILKYKDDYSRVIVDNSQSYFQMPAEGTDTLYTCRKYFGVADGAFLYTDAELSEELLQDESHERMGFLLGRYERPASEFYAEYVDNNAFFADEPVKRMSKLTCNLLHGIDYERTERTRRENFEYLHEKFESMNMLEIRETGTFMYPLLAENGAELRKTLQKKKIYIPTLWPSVIDETDDWGKGSYLAENILPLPIDQRYDWSDMDIIIREIRA